MVETVDRYGLKSRFLRKHLSAVDRFYRQISDVHLQSEIAIRVKERLEKNRDKVLHPPKQSQQGQITLQHGERSYHETSTKKTESPEPLLVA